MTEGPRSTRATNPFSTRFVRPGALRFQFAPAATAEQLVRRLEELNWRAQIVGAHGTGKSTLLAALLPVFEIFGVTVKSIALHDRQRTLPAEFLADMPAAARTETTAVSAGDRDSRPKIVLVVDGYEQLSRWSRSKLRRFCQRHGLGLLVTSHQSVGLPMLFETQVNAQLAAQLATELQQTLTPDRALIGPDDAAAAFVASGGNLRESFFVLYDLYQQRQTAQRDGR